MGQPDCVDQIGQTAGPCSIDLRLGQRGLVAIFIDIDTENPDQIARAISRLPPITAAKGGKRRFSTFFKPSALEAATGQLDRWRT
jgi:hypothetical protein